MVTVSSAARIRCLRFSFFTYCRRFAAASASISGRRSIKAPLCAAAFILVTVYHKRCERASLWANILRAFCIVRLGILTYSVVVRSKNHHKISRPQVPCSFDRADFCPGEKKDAGNTPVFASLLTMHGQKDADQNLVCSYRLWYTIRGWNAQACGRIFQGRLNFFRAPVGSAAEILRFSP